MANVSKVRTTDSTVYDISGSGGSGGISSIQGTAPINVTGSGSSRTVSISDATSSASGAMSSSDKAKLDGITAGAEPNRTYNSVTGKPNSDQTPGFGSTFDISQISQSATGQVTATDRTVKIPDDTATQSSAGLMSATDKAKLDGITNYAGSPSVGGNANATNGILYGEVDSTSTSTVFTATVPGLTSLYDGVAVLLKNGVVTSASGFTININGLGAKRVYTNLAAATAETTKFNVNYTLLFIYDSDRVSGGCWICYNGYDSNTNTIGYQIRTNSALRPASDTGYRYRLWFTALDGHSWVPANTSTSTNATASRTPNTRVIDPFGEIIYYSTNGTTQQGANLAATTCWTQYTVTLGYSFNTTGAALSLTNPAPVYVQCTPQSGGGVVMNGYTQSLPSTADGKVYIFLGMAYNATTIELFNNHPVYYYSNGAIRLWTNAESGGSTETDPIFSAAPASGITSGNIANWNNASKVNVNGVDYNITMIAKTTVSGVSGVLVTYDDGSLNGDVIFFADGVGLNSVKSDIEAQIPTATSDLTNDSGFVTANTTYSLSMSGNVITLTGSDGSTSTVTLPVYNGGVS